MQQTIETHADKIAHEAKMDFADQYTKITHKVIDYNKSIISAELIDSYVERRLGSNLEPDKLEQKIANCEAAARDAFDREHSDKLLKKALEIADPERAAKEDKPTVTKDKATSTWTERSNISKREYVIQVDEAVKAPEKDGIAIKQIKFSHTPDNGRAPYYHLTLEGDVQKTPGSDGAKLQLVDIMKPDNGGTQHFNNGNFAIKSPVNWTTQTIDTQLNALEKGGFLASGDAKKIAKKLVEEMDALSKQDDLAKQIPTRSRPGTFKEIDTPATGAKSR